LWRGRCLAAGVGVGAGVGAGVGVAGGCGVIVDVTAGVAFFPRCVRWVDAQGRDTSYRESGWCRRAGSSVRCRLRPPGAGPSEERTWCATVVVSAARVLRADGDGPRAEQSPRRPRRPGARPRRHFFEAAGVGSRGGSQAESERLRCRRQVFRNCAPRLLPAGARQAEGAP